ncbi:MAG TPA: hypothetical protein VIK74_01010 [Parasegetibacter sp.]
MTGHLHIVFFILNILNQATSFFSKLVAPLHHYFNGSTEITLIAVKPSSASFFAAFLITTAITTTTLKRVVQYHIIPWAE